MILRSSTQKTNLENVVRINVRSSSLASTKMLLYPFKTYELQEQYARTRAGSRLSFLIFDIDMF